MTGQRCGLEARWGLWVRLAGVGGMRAVGRYSRHGWQGIEVGGRRYDEFDVANTCVLTERFSPLIY